MDYIYHPQGVCSMEIKFHIDGDVISNVRFTGGCNGNLKAISTLIDGWTVEQIAEKLDGNTCGMRSTSCADQLARAVREAYAAQNA
ncbi:MAG: TIGR03905 family TSCPD domain-containing protein [Lachnospiraceae bacterium]|nr:TIGR03905 family TSCPD domain-containing protein [Lachnospiraceae bacterium]